MSITGFDDVRLKQLLAENLTPSDFIRTRERLFGRDKALTSIDRALSSPGRQIFIYGDRGVGKTSLALTAAFLNTNAELEPIHVNCGSTGGYAAVIQAFGNAAIPVKKRIEKQQSRGSIGGGAFGFSANFSPPSGPAPAIPLPTGLNDSLDVIRYVDSISVGQVVVIIDEMERLNSGSDKDQFAEFIKNVSTVTEKVRFVFCGIGSDVTDLLGAHPSAGRVLETIELKTIPHDSLWQIIEIPARKLGISIDRDKLIRISQISDGFPHYVHLIGEFLFWNMFDDPNPVARVERHHFREAIRVAVGRTEAVLRNQYDKATKKTKNTDDYEEALWCLADKTSDRRQISDIYDPSYKRIMQGRPHRSALTKENLNQRLLSLRKESHGEIVKGYGAGWFSFRENIMRGFVRLDAENRNIELGRD